MECPWVSLLVHGRKINRAKKRELTTTVLVLVGREQTLKILLATFFSCALYKPQLLYQTKLLSFEIMQTIFQEASSLAQFVHFPVELQQWKKICLDGFLLHILYHTIACIKPYKQRNSSVLYV
jgi:hypothetical protein